MDSLAEDAETKRIHQFRSLEDQARYTFEDTQDYGSAKRYYGKLLDLAEGWIADKDPDLLWIRVHYSECLMYLGRDDEACLLQLDVLGAVMPPMAGNGAPTAPATEDEADIVRQILHHRVVLLNKLRARRRLREAVDTAMLTFAFCRAAFGDDDADTLSCRKSYESTTKQMLLQGYSMFAKSVTPEPPRRAIEERRSKSPPTVAGLGLSGFEESFQKRDKVHNDLFESPKVLITRTAPHEAVESANASQADGQFRPVADQAMLSPPMTPGSTEADVSPSRGRLSSTPEEKPDRDLLDPVSRSAMTAEQRYQKDWPPKTAVADNTNSPQPRLIRRDTRSRSIGPSDAIHHLSGQKSIPELPTKPDMSDAKLLGASTGHTFKE
jgi:hypothetical protein